MDVTRPVVSGMPVWPGDAPCAVEWTARIGTDSAANVAEIRCSAHTGTHADGPYHVLEEGARIGTAPLEAFIGRARVVRVAAGTVLDEEWARSVLEDHAPERLLIHTGAWTAPSVFPTAFAAPTPEAARLLASGGLRLLGTDAPSVDPYDSADLAAHRVLLAAGIAILENLLLDDVAEGEYDLIALPLRLMEADASPVRAVLRPLPAP
ncbi:cyclase family protein [Longimicrobium terrae]|uniref:Kynurenine formamidase n=1 Tax=Longimicrobium terrae TaxID=1639882 RepID=A0A841GUD2_9BACT|nr:cyclase family protein [Longimicrobium terrae]MBB4634152.1 arylformamidase [Longimicrobium terrae]MBB6068958.1 arylformamidase [Longimicrobium terrae]NNC28137.1 kynurenine formamidase [Longimicrobium terrae]